MHCEEVSLAQGSEVTEPQTARCLLRWTLVATPTWEAPVGGGWGQGGALNVFGPWEGAEPCTLESQQIMRETARKSSKPYTHRLEQGEKDWKS